MRQSNSTNGNPNQNQPMPKQYGFPKSGPTSQPQERLLAGIPVGLKNSWKDYEPDNDILPYKFGKTTKNSQDMPYSTDY